MPQTPPPKRRRGAPPGNTNAVKHGFYSSRFGPRRPQNLDPAGVNAQIVLLKVYINHVKELSPQLENVHDQAGLVRALCLAMSSLSHLMHLQRLLPGSVENKESARRVICQALASLSAEEAANPPTASSSTPADGEKR
jgi:hypothetical protein